MTAKQSRYVRGGIAKQTAKGSPATDAEFAFGVTGGSPVTVEISDEDVDPTTKNRVTVSRERQTVVPGANLNPVALPKSLGLLLLGATGAVNTTGTAPSVAHEFTSSKDTPYFTVFSDFDGDKTEVHDAKVESFELSFEGTARAEVSCSLMGCDIAFDSTYTETNAEDPNSGNGVLKGVGGTFNFDGATAKVSAGTASVSNNLTSIALADSVLPDDQFPGRQAVEVSLTIVPDNLDDWRKIVTGTASGTSPSDTPFFASCDLTLTNGTDTLQFVANRAAWLADHPEGNPDGEPTELELEGVVVQTTDGSEPYTFTLTNDVSAY